MIHIMEPESFLLWVVIPIVAVAFIAYLLIRRFGRYMNYRNDPPKK